MSSTIDPDYEVPPENTVVIDCEQLEVSGRIRSPTITAIEKEVSDHINNPDLHLPGKTFEIVTDGVSQTYTVTHDLGRSNLVVSFYDVTSVPQNILFVNWEPISKDEFRIVPDIVLPANRRIQIIIR